MVFSWLVDLIDFNFQLFNFYDLNNGIHLLNYYEDTIIFLEHQVYLHNFNNTYSYLLFCSSLKSKRWGLNPF